MNILWPGARGYAVRRLQERLVKLGYVVSDEMGHFGRSTRKAVMAFQLKQGMIADGIAGPMTLTALKLRRIEAATTRPYESREDKRELPRSHQCEHYLRGRSLIKGVDTKTNLYRSSHKSREGKNPASKLRPTIGAQAIRRNALPKIFLSYSHADVRYMKRLELFLKPLESRGIIDVWVDTRIEPGQEWRMEIKKALEAATVAVLLLSQDFIASDFIRTNELPPLLSAAKKRRTVLLMVLISPCTWEDALSKYQTINPPSKPLSKMDRTSREQVWKDLSELITSAMNR